MKKILSVVILCFIFFTLNNEADAKRYKIGEIVENKFNWIDSLANYGTDFCYGSILNDNDNITLNNFCEFTDGNENKFWSKVQIGSSNLESGLGKQQFLKASDKYKFLLEKDCKYAVSFFHEVNFLVELKCK